MESSEKQKLKAMLIYLFTCYGRPAEDGVLAMYIEDLEEFSLDKISNAIKEIRRDPKIRSMPLIADIRSKCCPQENNKGSATIAVGRIIEAITKFGWPNPKEAREYIGELGWTIVERNGSWEEVCKLDGSQIGIFRAQAITLGETILERAKAGIFDDRPSLPNPVRTDTKLLNH